MRGIRLGMLLLAVTAAVAVAASPASALSPSVETTAASGIGETGATLNGKVNPNGLETKYFFEYGTTTSYGSKTSEVSAGSGSSAVEKSQSIGSLTKNTVYHYRIVASNSSGTSQGADQTFTTAGPPEVTLLSATVENSGKEATLKAWVDPNGQSTTYQFQYGPDSEPLTEFAPEPAGSAGSSFNGGWVSYKITGLTPGHEYYWQADVKNAGGTQAKNGPAFRTTYAPSIDYEPVTESSRTEATLEAKLKPNGFTTKYYFEYGTTTAYGTKFASTEIGSGVEEKLVKQPLSGLTANTVYHYRVVAENFAGVHVGKDQTVTTAAPVTLYAGGVQIKTGTQLELAGTFYGTAAGGTAHCNEVLFSGKLSENPGALQAVESPEMKNSGSATCPFSEPGYTVGYTLPASGITLNYGGVSSENGSVLSSSFVFTEIGYLGGGKIYECEKKVRLHGTFKLKANLVLSMTGLSETLKGGGFCSMAPYASFGFAVTSGGAWVEAKP